MTNPREYQPRYQIGDRVSGKWNKIPFVGSVGNDRLWLVVSTKRFRMDPFQKIERAFGDIEKEIEKAKKDESH